MQYGRIVDIDLKIPPRPPGYAFVEVSILSWSCRIFHCPMRLVLRICDRSLIVPILALNLVS